MNDIFRTTIDHDSPIAYYYQLREILQKKIEQGDWEPGDKLPSESELCEYFDISRTVVRQALRELEYADLIYRRKGKGTFVSKPKISEGLAQKLTGFYHDMVSQGNNPVTQILDFRIVPANKKIAEKLHLEVEDKVYKLKRLRSVNDEPIVIVTTYLPYSLCGDIQDIDFSNRSLYAYLESHCGITLSHGRRGIEAVSASKDQASMLEIEAGSPLIMLESVTFLEDGTPIEYYVAYHRGDRSRFEVELVRINEKGILEKTLKNTGVTLPEEPYILKD